VNRRVLGIIGVLAIGIADAGAHCSNFDGFRFGANAGCSIQSAKFKRNKQDVKVTENATYVIKGAFWDDAAYKAAVNSVLKAEVGDLDKAFPLGYFKDDGEDDNAIVDSAGDGTLANMNAGVAAIFAQKVAAIKAAFGLSDDQIVLPKFTELGDESRKVAAGTLAGHEVFQAQDGNFREVLRSEITVEGDNAEADTAAARAGASRTAFLTDVFGEATAKDISTAFNGSVSQIFCQFTDKFNKDKEDGEAKDLVRDAAIPESTCKAHKHLGSFGLNAGFCKALGGFAIGVEGFGEISTGKCEVQAKNSEKAKSFEMYGAAYNFTDEVERPSPEITFKRRWTVGLRIEPGVVIGNCRMYIPVEAGLSRFEFNVNHDADALKTFEGKTPTRSGIYETGGVTYPAEFTLMKVAGENADTSDDSDQNANHKMTKSKFTFGFGLGWEFLLNNNCSIDLKIIHVPSLKFDLNTGRLGGKYESRVQETKFSFGFKFYPVF
jgi:hypothetical protein